MLIIIIRRWFYWRFSRQHLAGTDEHQKRLQRETEETIEKIQKSSAVNVDKVSDFLLELVAKVKADY